MLGALADNIRRQIVDQKCKGVTLLDIAEQNHLSYSTVCNIWKRYKADGLQGLSPHYERCGPRAPKCDALMYRAALWLKRHHQGWGAALICVMLQQRYADAAIPAERTLQRWFKAHGLVKAKSRLVVSPSVQACQVHDVWQIDAKEKLQLPSGQKACYLSIVDETSGCLLKAVVFPPLQYQ